VTSAQEALLEKADRSLRVASELLDGGHPDFAASRAYYAMFYAAEALLLGEGLNFSSHAAVIGAFGKHFAKTGRLPAELHRHLREAFDQRTLGDYTTGAELDGVGEGIGHAAAFVRAARTHIGSARA